MSGRLVMRDKSLQTWLWPSLSVDFHACRGRVGWPLGYNESIFKTRLSVAAVVAWLWTVGRGGRLLTGSGGHLILPIAVTDLWNKWPWLQPGSFISWRSFILTVTGSLLGSCLPSKWSVSFKMPLSPIHVLSPVSHMHMWHPMTHNSERPCRLILTIFVLPLLL